MQRACVTSAVSPGPRVSMPPTAAASSARPRWYLWGRERRRRASAASTKLVS